MRFNIVVVLAMIGDCAYMLFTTNKIIRTGQELVPCEPVVTKKLKNSNGRLRTRMEVG
jgi:hypothetical protein